MISWIVILYNSKNKEQGMEYALPSLKLKTRNTFLKNSKKIPPKTNKTSKTPKGPLKKKIPPRS